MAVDIVALRVQSEETIESLLADGAQKTSSMLLNIIWRVLISAS